MEAKKYWQIDTEKLAEDIKEIARRVKTEEDLKMGMEPLLQKTFKKMGVDINIVRYEKTSTTFRGRSDAVYGYLTIEYKVPSKLSRKTDVKVATEQLKRYLGEQAVHFGQQREDFLEKAVGVATDGKHILFLRFTKVPTTLQTPIPIGEAQAALFPEIEAKRGFQVLGPYPINKTSLANLLIFVRASARRPLTAKDLAIVFAPTCQIAQQAVSGLYSMLMRAQRRQTPSRIKVFFQEWDKNFGVVYGQELEKAKKSAAETAELYRMPAGVRLKQLLFAIHTFYAFLMKIISIELVSLQGESTVKSFVKGLTAMDDDELKDRLSYLKSGADFYNHGIVNFLEADFFSWYLDGWDPHIANVFRAIVNALSDFEPATPMLEPEWTRDLLQRLYELLVPRKLRHDLGEYYTPEWLAGYVVDKSGYKGVIGSRFLDPACGSGTFLVQAINKAIRHAEGDRKTVARHILENIVGFDLNPIAVLSARTNYLIAFSRLISYIRPISIPVYLCDSILTPTRYVEEGKLQLENTIIFTTTKGNYTFPISMKEKTHIDKFTSMMDVALRGKVKPENFKNEVKTEFNLPEKEISLLVNIYKRIKELDDAGENGFWARYIKNAFAPVYLGKFDFVIGNPPWVRWDYLSDDYRKRTLKLWQRYGLFSLRGYEARLGGGKKDFSMLFTYASADNYLKDNGILGFLITMEVFKSKGAGEGFRQFELKDKKVPFKVLSMEDMVDLQPFQSANKTSVFFIRKGEKTTYPVKVIEWKRKPGIGRILPDWSLDIVEANCKVKQIQEIPVNPDKLSSSWQTAKTAELTVYSKLKGQNPYKAYTGAFTTPYGVFWLQVKEVRPDNILVVGNLHERGKWEVKPVHTAIEPNLVFPAVSGGDILKFGVRSYFYLLISQDPHKRRGYDEEYLSTKFSLTYAYLVQFRDILVKRAAYKKYFCKEVKEKGKVIDYKPIAPFYSQFDISELTFARYRVTWKQMASKMSAVVLSSIRTDFGTKPMISTHTSAFFPVDNREEAHYLCAILNSDIVNNFIKSFSAAGRGFGTPSIMNNFAIPRFNNNNETHKRLARLSEKAHELVKRGKSTEDLEKQINTVVKKLWNIK
ncbi:N-6 DNA methylase [candidate division KSB1 bacterium]|nr:N-6 DNA methylase [candidate division KSB1 bacterium]